MLRYCSPYQLYQPISTSLLQRTHSLLHSSSAGGGQGPAGTGASSGGTHQATLPPASALPRCPACLSCSLHPVNQRTVANVQTDAAQNCKQKKRKKDCTNGSEATGEVGHTGCFRCSAAQRRSALRPPALLPRGLLLQPGLPQPLGAQPIMAEVPDRQTVRAAETEAGRLAGWRFAGCCGFNCCLPGPALAQPERRGQCSAPWHRSPTSLSPPLQARQGPVHHPRPPPPSPPHGRRGGRARPCASEVPSTGPRQPAPASGPGGVKLIRRG